MSNLETTRRIMEALAVPDFEAVRPHLGEDWVLEGPAPVPLGWDEFVAVHGGIVRGMSDFDWRLTDLAEDGEQVSMKVHVTGTHDGVIDVPLLGVEGLAPTGTRVELPEETITFTFRGDEVARVDVASAPGGGMVGLLERVGATVAAPPG